MDARGPVNVEELVQCIQEYHLERREDSHRRGTMPSRPKTEKGKAGSPTRVNDRPTTKRNGGQRRRALIAISVESAGTTRGNALRTIS